MIAAKTMGATDTRIVLREILPNVIPVAVTFSLITVAGLIVIEGTLAFLGLSVALPTPSWGNLINEGTANSALSTNPYIMLWPALAMFLLLLVDQPDRRPAAPALRHPRGPALMARLAGRRPGRSSSADAGDARRPAAGGRGPAHVVPDRPGHRAGRRRRVLRGPEGKTLGIVGESGSGKTVLSRSIMGLLPAATSSAAARSTSPGTS